MFWLNISFSLNLRRNKKQKKKILQGSHCNDTLKSHCCCPCAMIQLKEEIKKRGTIFQELKREN